VKCPWKPLQIGRAMERDEEKAELQRMCGELRIPSDFDIAQLSWRPDYDPFFYDHSCVEPDASTCFAASTFSIWSRRLSSRHRS
jgi:hypothetical protein